MIARFAIAIILLAVSGRAHAADAGCGQATALVEKAKCADPQLATLDGDMTTAFRQRLRAWNGSIAAIVDQDQREWRNELASIDTPTSEVAPACAPKPGEALDACIAGLYRQRIAELRDPAYPMKGVYRMGDAALLIVTMSANPGQIRYTLGIRPKGEGSEHFWVGDPDVLPDTSRMLDGQKMELLLPNADGDFGPRCRLSLAFSANAVDVVPVGGPCSGDAFTGHYMRQTESTRDWSYDIHW